MRQFSCRFRVICKALIIVAIQKINIDQFLELSQGTPVLDVRSPGEFHHAHIPGAVSFPLFTDEERKVVGTEYKQQSRQDAIKIGLEYFGPKMRMMVEEAERIVCSLKFEVCGSEQQTTNHKPQTTNTVIVHCWRGGMRSAGVAWLLDLYGFKVYTLVGGYKAFRSWVLKQFVDPYRFNILGGYTGSGKTETLKELGRMNENIVDLEDLAGHKGSAFGNIGLPPQPSQEMFENKLAIALRVAVEEDMQRTVWMEDESQRIGTVNIPQPLWLTMRSSPIFFVDIPFEERLEHLVTEYGSLDKEKVLEATARLQKRLGGLETKTAIAHLQEGNVRECFRILLTYYDKYYNKGLHNRENVAALLTSIKCTHVEAAANAAGVLASSKPVSV
jgi:tRNA 2-selenouridine synthase